MVYSCTCDSCLMSRCNFYRRPEISYCIVRGYESKSEVGIRGKRLLTGIITGGQPFMLWPGGELAVDIGKVELSTTNGI